MRSKWDTWTFTLNSSACSTRGKNPKRFLISFYQPRSSCIIPKKAASGFHIRPLTEQTPCWVRRPQWRLKQDGPTKSPPPLKIHTHTMQKHKSKQFTHMHARCLLQTSLLNMGSPPKNNHFSSSYPWVVPHSRTCLQTEGWRDCLSSSASFLFFL